MKIRLLYFAALRERLGVDQEALELTDGATVQDLLVVLAEKYELFRGLRGFRVAVNQKFAREADPISEGAEVAIIPPVAGGCGDTSRVTVSLTRAEISCDALLEQIRHPGSGAQVSFLGVVRDNHQGREVARIDYQAYEAMAEAELARIGERLLEAHPEVLRACLVHRFGVLEVGEASVGVAVSTGHRGSAFEACRFGIDAIKESVPIWKKEHYVEGDHHWVRADEMGAIEASQETPPGASSGT
jgi:molybdopterin synthase catalytic subunit